MIRALDPVADYALVLALLHEAADYIRLERDADPGPEVADEFFHDAPPGCDPAASCRRGLFADGRLLAVAEMALGYPAATEAYLGFLLVTPAARGTGAGQRLLRHMETEARAAGCSAIFLAVLEANPRGRAFWEREGFRLVLANRDVTLGAKTQIAHRLGKPL